MINFILPAVATKEEQMDSLTVMNLKVLSKVLERNERLFVNVHRVYSEVVIKVYTENVDEFAVPVSKELIKILLTYIREGKNTLDIEEFNKLTEDEEFTPEELIKAIVESGVSYKIKPIDLYPKTIILNKYSKWGILTVIAEKEGHEEFVKYLTDEVGVI